jgi:hypothetical protein
VLGSNRPLSQTARPAVAREIAAPAPVA